MKRIDRFCFVFSYSSIWKHEFIFIQSIDWNKIRDADSQIKPWFNWKSRLDGALGGVMLNRLENSVTTGPEKKKKLIDWTLNWRSDFAWTHVPLVPKNVFQQVIVVVHGLEKKDLDDSSIETKHRTATWTFVRIKIIEFTWAAALAKLSNALLIAAFWCWKWWLWIVSFLRFLSTWTVVLLLLLLDDDDDAGERKIAENSK